MIACKHPRINGGNRNKYLILRFAPFSNLQLDFSPECIVLGNNERFAHRTDRNIEFG